MQLFKLAFLAAGTSAMAIESRSAPWKISNFLDEHIPHGSYAVTNFTTGGDAIPESQCFHQVASKSANGIEPYSNIPCANPEITFSQKPAGGSGRPNMWVFHVTYGGESRYIEGQVRDFEEGGMPWEKLYLPKSFKLS